MVRNLRPLFALFLPSMSLFSGCWLVLHGEYAAGPADAFLFAKKTPQKPKTPNTTPQNNQPKPQPNKKKTGCFPFKF